MEGIVIKKGKPPEKHRGGRRFGPVRLAIRELGEKGPGYVLSLPAEGRRVASMRQLVVLERRLSGIPYQTSRDGDVLLVWVEK